MRDRITHQRRLGRIAGFVCALGLYPLAAQAVTIPAQKPQVSFAVQQVSAIIAPEKKPSPAVESSAFSLDALMQHFQPGGGARLSETDAARYGHVFAFQDVGDFDKADYEISLLEDPLLMGHVLYQRYMSPRYTSTYDELQAWMKSYADHPGANDIYKLAQRKKTASATGGLVRPAAARGIPVYRDMDLGPVSKSYLDSRSFTARQKQVITTVKKRVGKSPTATLLYIQTKEVKDLFNATGHDALRAMVAQSYFYNGKSERAFKHAAKSADRSGAELPQAGWIAGLSAWKAGEYETAAHYFSMAADARKSSGWMSSASAFWAARAYLRAYQPRKVSYWLQRATEHPRTFYGIMALRALGMEQVRFHWDVPELTTRRVKSLSTVSAGRRALALVDAGYPEKAAEELRRIHPGKNRTLQEAMFALSAYAGMPQMALRMGSAFTTHNGKLFDAALYPDTPWVPDEGYKVDRALLHAFMRQESRFVPTAKNGSSGARGLMQLMPATAKHVAQLSGDSVDTQDLLDPQVNVTLGQAYLSRLLDHPQVKGNLFKLMVAYNAGPGKLARWDSEMDYDSDPLMFIESIPAAETRVFLERVMANFWIYRLKYGQDTESLDHVVGGDWPAYVAQDITRGRKVADASRFLTW